MEVQFLSATILITGLTTHSQGTPECKSMFLSYWPHPDHRITRKRQTLMVVLISRVLRNNFSSVRGRVGRALSKLNDITKPSYNLSKHCPISGEGSREFREINFSKEIASQILVSRST